MQTTNETSLVAKMTTLGANLETSTEENQDLTAYEGIIEGTIAGTDQGVVVIPLDSLEQKTIPSKHAKWVAFNWQSRKVYWIESIHHNRETSQYQALIKIADLDGSSAELLISDTPVLCGLAVDQITGNFYYGIQGSNPKVQVCDSRGRTCVTIASALNTVGGYISDIALFPEQGLMFWSNFGAEKRSVTRANMDGSNATEIISKDICMLYFDEVTKRLYWTIYYWYKSIGHHDLNGNNGKVLLHTTMYPLDIAVDGDTVYFGGHEPNGVYSVTSDRQVASIANTASSVHSIALYGRNKVFSSRPNPCKNSPCANLCVLTHVSYTCL